MKEKMHSFAGLEVKPLPSFLYDTAFPTKKREELIMNVITVYGQDFHREIVEELFSNAETVLGEGGGLTSWKGDSQYSLDGHLYMPIPATIGDFISDCCRVWNLELKWDENLLKRGFKHEY